MHFFSYLIRGMIELASTSKYKLRKLYNQQKHATRIIYNDRYTISKSLMKKLNILNLNQHTHISTQTQCKQTQRERERER